MKSIYLIAAAASVAAAVGCGSTYAGKLSPSREARITTGGPTEDLVRRYKSAVEKNPNNSDLYNKYGIALIQLGRETGNLDWYQLGKSAFEKAYAINPKDAATLANLGWACSIFHDFSNAITYAEKSIQIDPQRAFAYGVLADSEVEGGQYDKAVANVQKMVDLKPNLESYSRVAQLRFITGDTKGAVYMFLKAIEAGGPLPESRAWVRTQLADVYWKMGAVAAAKSQYAAVLKMLPGYRHALAGSARVLAAEGKLEESAAVYEKACVGAAPIPYVVALGDVYAKLGKQEEAKRTYGRIKDIVAEHQKRGIAGDDIELAFFAGDHNRDLKESYDVMSNSIKRHSSVPDFAAFAWTASKLGKHAEAVEAIRKALSRNTQDAMLYYRAARIFADAGQRDESKRLALMAVSINPKFHLLFAEDAKRLAR